MFVAHVAPVFLRKARQHFLEMDHRAAAPARQRPRRVNAHFAFLVKQTPDERFGRQRRVEQFVVADRVREDRHMVPFGPLGANVKAFSPFFARGDA